MEDKTVKNDKKDALLADAIKQIEKQYGKGSIMKLGERTAVDVDAISSGSIKIDEAWIWHWDWAAFPREEL